MKIFSLSGNEIGKFTVNVKQTIYNKEECFHVIAKSDGTIDDVPCGTQVNAYIARNLETIEQDPREYIKVKKKLSSLMNYKHLK
jgi:hypothetical protein